MRMRAAGGFSLVELMVGMTLSLVLMAGAIGILFSSRTTYIENERLARIQEAGRTAMELVLRDIRASGFNGCSRRDPKKYINGLNSNTTLFWNFSQPIYGFEATGASWSPVMDPLITAPAPTAGSDVIVIRTTRQGQPIFRTTAATTDPTQAIPVDRDVNASVAPGATMIIGDCEYTSIFQVTGFAGAGATATISHADGAGAPGANGSNSITTSFLIDALVTQIDTVIYYVAPSNTPGITGPALWQKVGAAAPVLLVDGVENLQVRYGVDTDGDLQVDLANVTAAAVDAAGNWPKVASVSIALLVRSERQEGLETDGRTYNLLGQSIGPLGGKYQRSVYITTIALRNGVT